MANSFQLHPVLSPLPVAWSSFQSSLSYIGVCPMSFAFMRFAWYCTVHSCDVRSRFYGNQASDCSLFKYWNLPGGPKKRSELQDYIYDDQHIVESWYFATVMPKNVLAHVLVYFHINQIIRSQVIGFQRNHSKLIFFQACPVLDVSDRIIKRWISVRCYAPRAAHQSELFTSIWQAEECLGCRKLD